jgi:hypothetical protein
MARLSLAAIAAAVLLLPGTAAAQAGGTVQQQVGMPHRQVISANPFGLLLELFNAEYERVVSQSSTAGFGGSTFLSDDVRYVNADVFWRFYPQGDPLDGWAFGAKVGITAVDGSNFFGYGFDANRSWLLGPNSNFYVGVGFGLKRLYGNTDDLELRVIPTFRIVNVGIAF